MRFSSLCLAATLFASSVHAETMTPASYDSYEVPFITPKVTMKGKVSDVSEGDKSMALAQVQGCCGLATSENSSKTVAAPVQFQPQVIGQMPQMNPEQTAQVLEDAKQAWKGGTGTWPQMSLKERIRAIENFLTELGESRELIVQTLMWEIGKNRIDAEAEFDRTIEFCRQVIQVIRTDPEYSAGWQTIGSTKAFVRRAAIGIIMCLGPMNYPLNETYATLIPALLMGNVAIMKIPTVGGLAHLLTSKYERFLRSVDGSWRSPD